MTAERLENRSATTDSTTQKEYKSDMKKYKEELDIVAA
jgi:hypothetical protein